MTIHHPDFRPKLTDLLCTSLKDLDVVVTPSDHRIGHVTVGVFDVQITAPDGASLGQYPLEIAYPKNQDVVDTILYAIKWDEVYIYTDTAMHPVLAGRVVLGKKEQKTYTCTGGVYTIFDTSAGDISFEDAIRRSLQKKMWYNVDNLDIHFGSSYFPAIWGSAEVALAAYIDISNTTKPLIWARHWQGFDAETLIQEQTIQQIVTDFFAGKTSDMRLLLHAFELARKYKKKLTLTPEHQQDDHNKREMKKIPSEMYQVWWVHAQQTIADLQTKHDAYKITLAEKKRTPEFIKTYNLEVTTHMMHTTQEPYQAQMVVRKWMDTLDVAPYFWSEWKLYLITKLWVRPALMARDTKPHYISLSPTISNLELIAGNHDEDLEAQTNALIEKKIWNLTGEMHHIGSYYPSAGHNPEKTTLVLYACESIGALVWRKEFNCVETPIVAVEVDTIFQLYEQNVIKDPRLVLAANILKQKYDYSNDLDLPISTIAAHDRDRFQQVLNTPLQTDRFYKYAAEELGDGTVNTLHILFKQKSAWYRRVMSYVEEELGWFFAPQESLLSETDRHFFDAAVPAFAVPSAELAAKYQNYAAHDCGHYVQGTIVPTQNMSKESYIRLMSKTESFAVYDSDYRYPLELWLDLFESTIGNNKSLARSFNNLDITDPEEVRTMITQIEVSGVIPAKIVHHPNYAAERANIVYRVYRFHFMDKAHAAIQYDQWMQNQEIAKIMLRFGNCVDSEEAFEAKMIAYEKKIAAHGEWVNTIKAHVMRVLTRDLILPALKIWLVIQMLHNNHYDKTHPTMIALQEYIDELAFYKEQILTIHASITGIEANEKHIKAVRDADIITQKIRDVVAKFTHAYSTYDQLTPAQKMRLENNSIPYFTGFFEIENDVLLAMIEQWEKEQIDSCI